jgi:citrate/tricarballylate utilization protein
VLLFEGPATLFDTHVGTGAFYQVIPYAAMVIPALAVTIYGLWVFARGAREFWRETQGDLAGMLDLGAFWKATRDAFALRYLEGGEAGGCNYPAATFSQSRRWFHHLTYYGFLLDLASTTVAAVYHNVLHWPSPYPLLSWPVVLGTVGGVMLLIGPGGLLYLKWRSDQAPEMREMRGMDVAFLALLFLTSLSGLVLLAVRDTAAMGTLLVIHLGLVAGIFITAPYGKFAHVVYRYAALVRNSLEQARSAAGSRAH